MRSIRLRKENILIGNETTLSKFFKETRGINYLLVNYLLLIKILFLMLEEIILISMKH